jgi:hypothetical protein
LAVGLSRIGDATKRIGFVGCASVATLILLFTWRWIDAMQIQSNQSAWLLPGLAAVLVAAGSRVLVQPSGQSNNR